MMSPQKRERGAVRRALWLGGLLLTLGGLIGMHGLDNHDGGAMDAMAHVVMADATGASAHGPAASEGGMVMPAHRGAAAISALTNGSGRPGMHMGAAEMCMAVLVLMLAMLMLILQGGRQSLRSWLAACPARAPAGRGRDPDPPSLFRLSIQRC